MNIKGFVFNPEKNNYSLRIADKSFELSREEAVTLHNLLNKVLKSTPTLFPASQQ